MLLAVVVIVDLLAAQAALAHLARAGPLLLEVVTEAAEIPAVPTRQRDVHRAKAETQHLAAEVEAEQQMEPAKPAEPMEAVAQVLVADIPHKAVEVQEQPEW